MPSRGNGAIHHNNNAHLALGQTRQIAIYALALAIVFLVAPGCAKGRRAAKQKFVKECTLVPGQENSFQGFLPGRPTKVSFQSGIWNASQVEAIVAAGTTWNAFFTASKNFNIFDIGGNNTAATNLSAPTCNAGFTEGVILYPRTAWTKSPSAVAVTSITSCAQPISSNGQRPIMHAIIEFNFVNFFVTGKQLPDLQTIAVHEFGHLVGLDHSCGALENGQSNIACPDFNTDSRNELVKAAMFPNVVFDPVTKVGEIKREINSNDQGRANCLYE